MSGRPSTLTRLYRELVEHAAKTKTDAGHTLRNGARVAVRERDGLRVVTFSRRDVELGERELDTFIAHCEVPAGAERLPPTGQRAMTVGGRPWFAVSFRWPLTADMFGEKIDD